MTDRERYLIACLAEECAEVTQACMKALRFGLSDGYPGTTRTNAKDIHRESCDLVAILSLLSDEGIIEKPDYNLVEEKIARTERYWVYAQTK